MGKKGLKTKVSKLDQTRRLLEIEVDKINVAEEFERMYAELSKSAHIPGYRIGKAPKDLLEKHYKDEVRSEVIKHLVPEALEEALIEGELAMLGYPDIKDVMLGQDKILKFKAEFDIMPEVEVKKYKKIPLKKVKIEIKDDEVENYLKNLRENLAQYYSVERPAKLGDYLIVDFELYVDGKPQDKKMENQTFLINENFIIPPAELVGLVKSTEKDVEIKLPDDYHDERVRGKKARFHIKIKEIKEKKLLEINDDFAKNIGDFKDLSELKDKIRNEISMLKENQAKSEMEQSLLDAILKGTNFDVPKKMVEHELEHLVHEAKERLFRQGFVKDEIEKKDQDFREKFKDAALRQVKVYFILNDIAKKEKIEAADSDLEDLFEDISKTSKRSKEEIKSYYEKNDYIGRLKEDIRERKTIEFLLKEAEIIEE